MTACKKFTSIFVIVPFFISRISAKFVRNFIMPGFLLEITVCHCLVERIKGALVLRDGGEKQLIFGNSDRPDSTGGLGRAERFQNKALNLIYAILT